VNDEASNMLAFFCGVRGSPIMVRKEGGGRERGKNAR